MLYLEWRIFYHVIGRDLPWFNGYNALLGVRRFETALEYLTRVGLVAV